MSGNGFGNAAAETWAQFDALPRSIKEIFWRAPYKFTARPHLKDVRAAQRNRNLSPVRADMIAAILRACAAQTRKTYGEDHPCFARFGGQPKQRRKADA